MAFTVIETQEQLDQVIGDRIKRAEAKAAEKYADYESLKTQNASYATQISQLNEQLQKQTETITGNKTTIEDLTNKVHKYETDSVKTAVALEMGLPYQMAGRLAGNNEEEIRADAEAMAKLIGSPKPAAPLGSSEPVNTNTPDAAWSKFAAQLTGSD